MHALITGGSGFIGSHLSEALLAQGHTVTALDNLSTGRSINIAHLTIHSRFQFVHDTITNEMVADRIVGTCDIIFHLAAAVGVELVVKDPMGTLGTNLHGMETVLKLAHHYRKKVILASTSEMYGKSDDLPFREDSDRVIGSTAKSRWSYVESKAFDEFMGLMYHRQFGVPIVICRFFNAVGPRQIGSYVIPRLVNQALAGEPLTVYGDGNQTRCFCNVKDTVRAVIALAMEPKAVGEIYNIGSQEEITMADLARRIRDRAQSHSSIKFIPYDEAYEKGFEDMPRRVPCIAKIKSAVGWEPIISLDQTLDEII